MKQTTEPRAHVSVTPPPVVVEVPVSPTATSSVRPVLTPGERVQLVLAGGLWIIAALILGIRGAGWLLPVEWMPALFAAGVVLGLVKSRVLLDRIARGVSRRIHDRGPTASIVGFLSVRSWVVVVVMMAGGHALRLTAAPRPALGVLYVGIATALTVASRVYWRVLARGWDTLG